MNGIVYILYETAKAVWHNETDLSSNNRWHFGVLLERRESKGVNVNTEANIPIEKVLR